MYLFVFACMKYYCKHQLLDFFLNFERDTPCHHVISIYPGSISVEAQGTCFFTIVPVIQKYPVHPRKLTAGYPSDALEKRCTPKIIPARDPKQCQKKKRKQGRVVIPRANHNTHRTTFVISSRTGCCRTPKSTKGTTKNHHQFLGRMLQSTEKYEKYHEKWTCVMWASVLGPDVAEHRKVRKVPRKITISSRAGCCRAPKSTKSSRQNEHQFLGRMLQNTQKYEN